MVTHPVFLPGKFHGQQSLVDYSPRDHKELDTMSMHIPTCCLFLFVKLS